MMLLIALLGAAQAADTPRVVHADETMESIADVLGEAVTPELLRELNDLSPGEQPETGTIIVVPLAGADPSHAHGGAILTLAGTGTMRAPDGNEVPLSLGLTVPEGGSVCTDGGSYATVRLAVAQQGRVHDDITLLENTCAIIEAARSGANERISLVSLRTGSLSVRAAEETPGTVTILTESGVTTGESGGFRVTIEEEASRTEALYSPVSVMGAGEEVPMDAGYGSRIRNGEAPSAPVALLPPGAPTAPTDGAILKRPDFVWRGVDDALGYRVEVSTTPDFSELVVVEDVTDMAWYPEVFFVPFRAPGLWWRVSSFDRTGFMGVPSDPRMLQFPTGMGP